jgi:hypothetical protein
MEKIVDTPGDLYDKKTELTFIVHCVSPNSLERRIIIMQSVVKSRTGWKSCPA